MPRPKLVEPTDPTLPHPPSPYEGMTGVAFTLQASKDQGFTNFRICTLFILDGQIIHVEKSQEYATFEAISRTELLVNSSAWNLSSRYRVGAYQSLGGDARDALINRLKRNNPEVLEKLQAVLTPQALLPSPGTA